MTAINTDFSDFELATCDVMNLSHGLVPEIAEVFEYSLPTRLTPEDLGGLVDKVGSSKVLQDNIPRVQEFLGTDEDAFQIAANWVERSGVQKELNRSLWTPAIETPDTVQFTVISGGVANWQDRSAGIIVNKREASSDFSNKVVYLAGSRVMDSPTETSNGNIQEFFDEQGRYPAEFEYAERFIGSVLRQAGFDPSFVETGNASGDEQALYFARYYDNFNPKEAIAFARVANAGVMLAGQYRKALQDEYRGFDADAKKPKAFVMTDSFTVARSQDELDPKTNQNPFTALRMIIVTAKTIQQAKRIQRLRD